MTADLIHEAVSVGWTGSKKAVDLLILCNTSMKNTKRSWRASKRRRPTKVHLQFWIPSSAQKRSYISHAVWPLADVENPMIGEHINYECTSLNAMKKYMSKLMTHVESKISLVLPDRFAIEFDEQTTPIAHYVAVFATISMNDKKLFDSACLALSPLENETSQEAHEHVRFLSFVLGLFGNLSRMLSLLSEITATLIVKSTTTWVPPWLVARHFTFDLQSRKFTMIMKCCWPKYIVWWLFIESRLLQLSSGSIRGEKQ